MSVKVASNRFIVSSNHATLYQQIFTRISDFQKLGEALVLQAEWFQATRDIEKLEAVAEILSNIPYERFQLIGQYYLGWCGYRKGEDTRASFEVIVEESSVYRAKALISLAGVETARKDYVAAGKFYQEAIRWSQDPSSFVSAVKGIAVFRSADGDHKGALKDLQALYPIARYSNAKVYYDYLNSLAVELGELGLIQEARNISRIVLASPLAFAYPEWRDTDQENAEREDRSRASVSVEYQSPPPNVRFLPDPEPGPFRAAYWSRVYNFEECKKKMGKKKTSNPKDQNDQDDPEDMILKIMEVVTRKNFSLDQYQDILTYIEDMPEKG